MMEGDGKCRAEAEARGLPANRDTGIRGAHKEKAAESEGSNQIINSYTFLHSLGNDSKNIISQLETIMLKSGLLKCHT